MDTERYEKCGAGINMYKQLLEICPNAATEFVVEGGLIHSRCAKHSISSVLNTKAHHSLQDALAALAMERL